MAVFPGTNQLLRSSLHLARGKAYRNRSTAILSNEKRASAPAASCFCGMGLASDLFAMRHQSSVCAQKTFGDI
ncbi:hypothetical protein AJ88_21485 [Mesorhizobium amorphae CCBAU 01583]|nr:hypothetical protein AJ88_21485 [Mesorhizobium amorphae CCBAU 01583]